MAVKKLPDRARLGRGLAALLGGDATALDKEKSIPNQSLQSIFLPVELLEPGPFQPRQVIEPEALEELANSIRHHGILQPLLVRKHPSKPEFYQIIAGERRWRAAQQATLHEVPVRVCELSDVDAMAVSLVENLQRADLNVIEEADGFERLLKEFQLTQDELAKIVGKSRPHITNTLRLLQLSEVIRQFLKEGKLTAGHARALLSHPDSENLAKKIIKDNLTVRQTEALVKQANDQKEKQVTSIPKAYDPELQKVEKELQKKLGLRTKVQFDGRGGSIQIFYQSLEQFDMIFDLLKT